MGLVGDAEAKGDAREGRNASGEEEEDKSLAGSYHDTVMLVNLRKAVCWATNREGGGCLLPDDQLTKTVQPVAEFLRENHLDMPAPPSRKIPCAQPSRSMRMCPKRYPLTSQRMT